MFNIGMMELLVVLLVAFLVVGPKDLPKVARWIARQVKKLRKLIREIKRDTGWDELAAEFKDTKDDLTKTFKEADVSEDLRQTASELNKEVNEMRETVAKAANDVRTDIEGGNNK